MSVKRNDLYGIIGALNVIRAKTPNRSNVEASARNQRLSLSRAHCRFIFVLGLAWIKDPVLALLGFSLVPYTLGHDLYNLMVDIN